MHYRVGATVYYEREDDSLVQGIVVDVKSEHVDIKWITSLNTRPVPYRYEWGHVVLKGLHQLCSDVTVPK